MGCFPSLARCVRYEVLVRDRLLSDTQHQFVQVSMKFTIDSYV